MPVGAPTQSFSIRAARPGDAPRLAFVRAASWRAAYREIIPARTLERIVVGDGERMRRAIGERAPGEHVWIAQDDDNLPFGYAWCGPQRDRRFSCLGEIYELYLHPTWQRRGAGRRLLVHALWQIVERGLAPVMVWVLAENDARFVYEGCGAVAIADERIQLGSRPTTKIAYAWRDTLPLPGL